MTIPAPSALPEGCIPTNGHSYTRVDDRVLDSDLTCQQKMCLIVLLSYMFGDKTTCFPTKKTIAAKMRLKLRQVSNILDSLVTKKWLVVVKIKDRNGKWRNEYRIKIPASGVAMVRKPADMLPASDNTRHPAAPPKKKMSKKTETLSTIATPDVDSKVPRGQASENTDRPQLQHSECLNDDQKTILNSWIQDCVVAGTPEMPYHEIVKIHLASCFSITPLGFPITINQFKTGLIAAGHQQQDDPKRQFLARTKCQNCRDVQRSGDCPLSNKGTAVTAQKIPF
jgi:hypothetical protein